MILCNSQQIEPMPVIIGKTEYPQGIIERIKNNGKKVVTINALEIAEELGNAKCANVVMLGLLAKKLDIDYDDIKKALLQIVKPKFIDINLKALERGYNY